MSDDPRLLINILGENPLLTTAQAAERLGVSPRRVVALITAGRLPAAKFGRDWVIREADLAAVQRLPQGWPKGRPRK
jgi:excisionase family DNA binding protein